MLLFSIVVLFSLVVVRDLLLAFVVVVPVLHMSSAMFQPARLPWSSCGFSTCRRQVCCKFGGLVDPLLCFSRLALLVVAFRGGAHLGPCGWRRHALRGVRGALAPDAGLAILSARFGASVGWRSLWVFSVVLHSLAFLVYLIPLFMLFAVYLLLSWLRAPCALTLAQLSCLGAC